MKNVDVGYLFGPITLEDALNEPAPLDFDARPARGAVLTARITCRVCDKPATVPILSSGLLCEHCRRDLDATARHITQVLEATEARFVAAVERWDADYAHAEVRDQERYQNVGGARAALSAAEFARKYDRAYAKGDGLSMLLQSKERCDAVAVEVERVRAWASAALEEVEAASNDR
jgi:hypothetical protein